MLKNIRLHLEKDEEKQKKLEASLAQSILETHHKNINSFARNIPSLSSLIKQPQLQNYSLFCNKFGEINIVDYGVGRTLYGFHPKQEIQQQVDSFNAHGPCFSLQTQKQKHHNVENQESDLLDLATSKGYKTYSTYPTAPLEIECLVVLGCGLGLHILELMRSKKIRSLILYEPELQYFQCSILVNRWSEIFDLAKEKGSKIFIQVEKDGRNLVSDIDELVQHENITSFYVYQHYNHPVFNSLLKELNSKSWSELQENGISFNFNDNYSHFVPTWTASVSIEDYSNCSRHSEQFTRNLVALEKYFPDIYKEYKDYQPKIWLPVRNKQGQINIVKADSLSPFYSDNPKQDCLYNYENYNEQPHKDGLVLGYKGTKLAHYLHYQFVKETEQLIAEAEDEIGALPEDIASIIIFGLGVGYQLEALLDNHHVEKLFLCEPNTDFFYASLFAIDWSTIFEKVEESKGRIYLNIGDDGTHLFRDLLNQFYAIGPYILNNTYFYQSYYNASLNSAIAQLREQLQIVISMGEYFDHAYYGIEHTKEGFRRNIPVLTKNPSSKLSYDDKEVPVFIVGNGPSLDLSIDAIKEWRDQAIIVSCGTALQALHRNGITPDFHAEIEQNRSTYDWAVLTGDLAYLKDITLISCNGIHPDTCALYKNVLVAFKEGESSTVSALSVLGQENFEVLQHAFPTVSNFVVNLISVIGFNHIYLMGVDLGFINVKHHHSKSSGYYKEDGQEIYDYAENNNTSLVVPGNFRPSVNTKHEFKVSRQIIEQVTHKKPKLQTFYNCSDGAKISGTTPLHINNLLIVSISEQKYAAIERLKTSVYTDEHNVNFIQQFEQKFSPKVLERELNAFEQLLSHDIETTEQAEYIINKQKEMLFTSYQQGQSLLFYYLYGTVNYSNAVLTKLTSKNAITTNKAFYESIHAWQKTIAQIKAKICLITTNAFDASGYSSTLSETKWLELNYKNERLLIVVDSDEFKVSAHYLMSTFYSWFKNIEILTFEESKQVSINPDYSVYLTNSVSINPPLKGKLNTIVLTKSLENINLSDGISYLLIPKNCQKQTILVTPIFVTKIAIMASLLADKCQIIIPKFWTSDETLFEEQSVDIPVDEPIISSFLHYVCIYNEENTQKNIILRGSRGKVILENLKMKHLLYKKITDEELNTNFRKVHMAIIEPSLKE
tara:strand:+ start:1398 stop:4919 length:3522 start_codon:yes stop_codon:yes gene_type:complete